MRFFRPILLLTCLLLTACAAQQTPELKYYLLSSSDQATDAMVADDTQAVLGIAPITVADYINTDGLALLSNENQIHIARYHRWAEKPEHAIARTLQTDLSQLLKNYRIDNAQESNSRQWNLRLRLHIDQFHGTEAGKAIISGFWRLDAPEENRVIASQRFLLQSPLSNPGYGEMVKELRSLIAELANQLSNQVNHSR